MWPLTAGFLSLCLCWALIRIAPKDAPDDARKTQSFAVPTSGGIAIAAAIALSLCASIWTGHKPLASTTDTGVHVLLTIFVLILGAVDDATDLPAKPKLAALLLAALLTAHFGQAADRIFFPVADAIFLLPEWLAIIGTALWLFILMNASNFMDGSNGLSVGTLAIMIAALGFSVSAEVSGLEYVIATAMLGFLFWNLQGKLYAGDAGSLFGGAVFASLSVFAAKEGNIWQPATLALPFLIDVFMTLGWRAMHGHNLLQPHRHHAYQGLIKSGWSHIKTALLWWGFAAICATSTLWATADSKAMSAYVFFGLLAAGCGLWLIHRGHLSEAINRTP